ncbi:MAG: hypothetical protein JXB20_02090 [Bacilli bacterium]|nr:hypothetical protein [Bacilli bacterium]MBN2696174.1 hypothetical protein [Bacilli bacterium]
MIPAKRSKIHSEFEIRMILFYATMLLLIPNVLVVTYLFDIDQRVDIIEFIFWLLIGTLALSAIGTAILFMRRDFLKRRVKPTYRGEFIYLLFISAFGLLGIAVLYDYLGGNRQYIANVLIVVFALMLYILIMLGRRYFKFEYMGKK